MKTQHCITKSLIFLVLAPLSAFAQSTAFTYQGRLNDGMNPASGIYDLRFTIYDSTNSPGNIIAGPLVNTATKVSNGFFCVTLDFGTGVFTGVPRWLNIAARTNGSASFTTLSPRQELTSTPYAILASGVDAGGITASMLASGAVTTDKIAAGAVKGSQIDDGGSAAYLGLQSTLEAIGGDASISFAGLAPVTATNGAPPALTLAINGANFGTVMGFSGSEGISRPYSYVVQVRDTGAAVNPDSEIGLSASLNFTRNGRTTSFGGIITACALSAATGTSLLYTVRIDSPLALMALTTDYRVNQGLTAPNEASTLYQTVTSNNATLSLMSSYTPHENLIQYAETDLNFFSRLLEYEGVFYFFNQAANPPGLILGDSSSAYLAAPNSPFAYVGDTASNTPAGGEFIRTFQKAIHQSSLKSSVYAYNFQTPSTSLPGSSSAAEGVGELYEFGTPVKTAAYDRSVAQWRLERQTVERQTIAGSGTAPDLRAGYSFTLTDQTGAGLSGSYVVTEVHHAGFVRVTNGVSTLFYGNQFKVVPASLPYRPALQTPKPQAQPCTAVVTGPAGQEISVDQDGRVKVQFHWDRYGVKDLNSSAWLRITSPMASSHSRGMLFLPRIGDEVLVSFVQGDPDQPLVTGSLYNSQNFPPFALPAGRAVSTIRTTGTPAQPNQINEIKFDDTAGTQILSFQAAKDLIMSAANNLYLTASNSLAVQAKGGVNLVTGGAGMSLDGPLTASGFNGDGSGLTGLNASQLTSGTVPLAQLSGAVVTNNAAGVSLTGTFNGAMRLNDNTIWFRGGSDKFHGLGWFSTGSFAGANPDGPVLFGAAGGGLGYTGNGTNLVLAWNNSSGGDVFLDPNSLNGGSLLPGLTFGPNSGEGISSKRTVGTGQFGVDFYSASALRMRISNTGNVGIANSNPTNLLVVASARCDGTTWINASDRTLKQDFALVDPQTVLAKVAALPVQTWSYKTQPGQRHLGPVAQDFHAAFNLGADDTSIATVDEGGVALAAIQGLNQKLEETRTENAELKQQLKELKELVLKLSGNQKGIVK